MNFTTLAYIQNFTPGNQSAATPSERVDTWTQGRSFRCTVAPMTGAQIIRQGRDSAEKSIRVYYRPFDVSLVNSSKLKIAGVTWDVVYADPVTSRIKTAFVECREVVE